MHAGARRREREDLLKCSTPGIIRLSDKGTDAYFQRTLIR
jgi:hypothetical protein